MPCGVVVRAVAPHLENKRTDPAIVVVDAGGRYAVSLLSGHEGGANDLAVKVANILGAEPVITTTTEALKDLVVGIGCRRGVEAEAVVSAVREALRLAGGELSRVRFLASADIKAGEEGLLDAARRLGVPVRFVGSEDIRSSTRSFDRSDFVEEKVNLPAVAEPATLLAGRRTTLILRKTVLRGLTVAVARESFMWSE
jgi:cobalt-precorrin 5A hydrolase